MTVVAAWLSSQVSEWLAWLEALPDGQKQLAVGGILALAGVFVSAVVWLAQKGVSRTIRTYRGVVAKRREQGEERLRSMKNVAFLEDIAKSENAWTPLANAVREIDRLLAHLEALIRRHDSKKQSPDRDLTGSVALYGTTARALMPVIDKLEAIASDFKSNTDHIMRGHWLALTVPIKSNSDRVALQDRRRIFTDSVPIHQRFATRCDSAVSQMQSWSGQVREMNMAVERSRSVLTGLAESARLMAAFCAQMDADISKRLKS